MARREPWNTETAKRLIAERLALPGALLPMLHALQAEFGHVDPAAVPMLAEALNLSRAEVHGVVTFYHEFRRTPPGRRVVRLCRAEACQSVGGEALAAHASKRLGIDFHQTTADGEISLEPVFCLGLCACSPAVAIDGKVYGRVDADGFDRLMAGTAR